MIRVSPSTIILFFFFFYLGHVFRTILSNISSSEDSKMWFVEDLATVYYQKIRQVSCWDVFIDYQHCHVANAKSIIAKQTIDQKWPSYHHSIIFLSMVYLRLHYLLSFWWGGGIVWIKEIFAVISRKFEWSHDSLVGFPSIWKKKIVRCRIC